MTVRQGYGLTETAALISTNPAGHEKPGSVGLPIPGVTVRIVDDSRPRAARRRGRRDLLPLAGGDAGLLDARRRPPPRRSATDGSTPGDIGYLDEEGYLFIVDRKKDLIIRGGFNVYPRDVEDALLEHPAVAAAGVVGRPDERHGEEVVAFVSLRRARCRAATDELIGWARQRIGGYKYPREVHIVDAIPLTAVGKLDRKALRGRWTGLRRLL